MTACIVGWAHTPFGKLDGETVESLIVRVATEALADAGIAPADVDEIVLGHFNAGFSAQDFTASLVLQASPDLRFKRATRVENACATGSAAVHQGLKSIDARGRAHRAGGRRRADDDDAGGRRSARTCSRPPMCARRPTSTAASPASSARSPALYFQKYGDQSDALAHDRRQEPQERRRQSLCADAQGSRLRLLPHREREEPVRRRPAQAHRLLAGLRRRRRGRARRRRDRAAACDKAVVFRAAEHVQDFLPMAKRDILKFEGCARGLAARARASRASRSTICRSSRRTTASPSPN